MPKILLIEDDDAQRELVRHVLEPHGLEIREAENGAAGIRALGETEFDAILVDLRMPKLSGEFVIQWIVANRPDLRDRILVITGDLLSPGLDAFLDTVQVPMLAKPYLLNDLVEAVKKLVANAPADQNVQSSGGSA
jgi:CheY-like chemotaxis protein